MSTPLQPPKHPATAPFTSPMLLPDPDAFEQDSAIRKRHRSRTAANSGNAPSTPASSFQPTTPMKSPNLQRFYEAHPLLTPNLNDSTGALGKRSAGHAFNFSFWLSRAWLRQATSMQVPTRRLLATVSKTWASWGVATSVSAGSAALFRCVRLSAGVVYKVRNRHDGQLYAVKKSLRQFRGPMDR